MCLGRQRMRSYDGVLDNEVVEMKNFLEHTMRFSRDEVFGVKEA